MNEILVTVVIPVFNAGEFLRAAVLSITTQTHHNLEIIIIDDGSTDGCLRSIQDLKDERITVITQENAGKAAAVNKALDLMKGEFWLVQDADDISHPERVERQLEAMIANPEIAAVYVCIEIIVRGKQFAPRFIGKSSTECLHDVANLQMPAHDATGMFRMSLLKDIRIDPELRIGEGFDLMMRVGEQHPMMVIDGCWYSHRLNPNSLTHQDSQWNIEQVNLATQKACARRHLDYQKYKVAVPRRRRFFKHRDQDTVVSYAVVSVRQLKQVRNYKGALNTALRSAWMHPLDPIYYKPLLLLVTPTILFSGYGAINRMRWRKRNACSLEEQAYERNNN